MKKTGLFIAFSLVILLLSYGQNITDILNLQSRKSLNIESKKILIDSDDEIYIKTGSSSITMKKDGTIIIEGKNIVTKGEKLTQIKGTQIINN